MAKAAKKVSKRRPRVLSLDGGGIRGVLPAMVLEEIERRVERPISDCFDLIAGTSTGGILACGIAVSADDGNGPKFQAKKLVDLYVKRGGDIFSWELGKWASSLGGMSDEKWSCVNLERILDELLGDQMLSQARQRLLVTAYDIHRRSPHFFKSWRAQSADGKHMHQRYSWPDGEPEGAPYPERPEDRDFRLRDVCRATSAAPTYFEAAAIRNAVRPTRGDGPAADIADQPETFALIDGGVFANNPAMCAYVSARELFDTDDMIVVSLGTGLTERKISYEQAKDWGPLGWLGPVLYILMDGNEDAVDYHMRNLLPARGNPPARRYFRFQTDLKDSKPGVDDGPNDDMDDATPENIKRLRARGKRLIKRSAPLLDELETILKSKP